MASGQLDRVALGHTRRDQAETVLFRFLRGAATAGLAGIRPVTSDGIVRPLLEIGRGEIEAWLRERNIPWREDSTNASPAFARNRIRHHLLPQLARDWNPQIEETLARTADWAQAEEAYWQSELEGLGCGPILDIPTLRRLPTAVARRLIRAALAQAKGDLRSVDFLHVESILRLIHSPGGHGAVQVPGVEILRSFSQIRISPHPAAPPAPYHYLIARSATPLAEPLSFPLPGSSIHLEAVEKSETSPLSDYVYNSGMGCLDWGRLSGSLVLRNWNPGDRFQPVGSAGPRKIKSLFQSARIPWWEREQWPVLVDGASVVWTRRFGASAAAAVTDRTRVILRIREEMPASAAPPPNSESGSGGLASNRL
jgi:tRNA(Ile)-lysidine synthase